MFPDAEPLPTPNKWLADRLKASGVSQNGLARSLNISPPQVNRWVNGSEKVPRTQLSDVARQIGSLDDLVLVQDLKNCEEMVEALTAAIDGFAKTYHCDPTPLRHLVNSCVKALVEQERPVGIVAAAAVAFRFLNDAVFAVRSCRPCMSVVTRDTIRRHVQYPVNHFVGLLLGPAPDGSPGKTTLRVPEFGEMALVRLREMVKNRAVKSPSEKLARHHSIHLLARYGLPCDRDLIGEMVMAEARSLDPLETRLGFTGLMLSGAEGNVVEGFIHRLQRDDDLATANLRFDAMHYGDEPVAPDSFYERGGATFSNTIRQIVRHIEDAQRYRGILGLELVKLSQILDIHGQGPFRQPGAHDAVARILDMKFDDLPNDALRAWSSFVEQMRQSDTCGRGQRQLR